MSAGKPGTPQGPIAVNWAFVVGVDSSGQIYMISHEYVEGVVAKRPVTVDDIYAACTIGGRHDKFPLWKPSEDVYTVAFLVFQLPTGHIAASPDVFENIFPVTSPSDTQILGAFSVLQAQIIAQKAADMATPMAVQATLSVLKASVPLDPDGAKKSEGGLYVA